MADILGRHCPTYALAPLRPLGLNAGNAVMTGIVFGIMYFTVGTLYAMPVVALTAWFGEKMSAGREAKFAVHWLSARSQGRLAKLFALSYLQMGSIAPPGFQSHYDP